MAGLLPTLPLSVVPSNERRQDRPKEYSETVKAVLELIIMDMSKVDDSMTAERWTRSSRSSYSAEEHDYGNGFCPLFKAAGLSEMNTPTICGFLPCAALFSNENIVESLVRRKKTPVCGYRDV